MLNHTSHHHTSTQSNNRNKKLGFAIILNLLITIAQVAGGLISGSLSLLSDALHNFSDVIALIISYIASALMGKKHTVQKTFGYKRAEIVAAFTNTIALISIAILLIPESIRRFYDPKTIETSWVIVLSAIGILLNGFSVVLLHRDAHENLNIKASYLHLMTDMMTSVSVLVSGIIMYFFEVYWLDAALTIVIAGYLIYYSLKMLSETMKVLMLFTPSSVIISDISQKICAIPEVQNIHHIHVWQLDNRQIHFEGHVDFADNLPLNKVNGVLDQIRTILNDQFNINHVTLQPEFDTCHEKDLVGEAH